jgi:hypothetical protein
VSGIAYAMRGLVAPAALTLSGIGRLPTEGLLGYWDFLGPQTYLLDKSGMGRTMAVDPQAADVRWSKGLLANGSNAAILTTDLRRGAGAAGNRFTAVVVYRAESAAQSYLLSDREGRGISLTRAGAHCGFVYSAGTGGGNIKTGEIGDVPGKSFDCWIMYAIGCDGSRIYLSLDGLPWNAGTAIDAAGVYPLLATSTLTSGDLYVRSAGQYAALAYWDRLLSADQLASTMRALRRQLIAKGGML